MLKDFQNNVYTAGSPILSTIPYRTVFRYNFYHARGLLVRGVPFFLPKIHRFSAKKVKSANRTVLKIETVLAF
jgi:hypothetical protein